MSDQRTGKPTWVELDRMYTDAIRLIAEAHAKLAADGNSITKLVDEERRRWYAAIEARFGLPANDLEGLAPEVVVERLDTASPSPPVTQEQRRCPQCGSANQERIAALWLCQVCGHEWNDSAPVAPPVTCEWRAVADKVVQSVVELPDRTSPDDWPEAMLVTSDELETIVLDALSLSSGGTPK